jgi:hypothetical protein
MNTKFTKADQKFLRACGIAAEPERDDAICNSPSAGWCDEPSYEPVRLPRCTMCGRSTRSRQRVICKSCEALRCDCGSGMEARILGRCAECATADDMNAWLLVQGKRPCPHSDHSSPEDFAACATTDEMNTFLEQRGLHNKEN